LDQRNIFFFPKQFLHGILFAAQLLDSFLKLNVLFPLLLKIWAKIKVLSVKLACKLKKYLLLIVPLVLFYALSLALPMKLVAHS